MHAPDPATLVAVEWPRLLEALAMRAATPDGARAASELPFLGERPAVERSLEEIGEAVALAEEGATPDLAGVPDVLEARKRLQMGAVLEDDELLGLARALSVAATARRALRSKRALAPGLAARADEMPDVGVEAEEILGAYGPDGRLGDHASPELRRARSEAETLRARVVALVEDAMAAHASVLQDRYTTLRGGRYVLPVRADAHERVPGIVHGTSQSGATLFVEPEAVVGVANRLRVALAAVEREEARVRAALTAELREKGDDVGRACDALSALDVRLAAADLARSLDLRAPRLVDEPCLRLVAARHPHLVLAGRDVVANDVPISAGKALVLSGPNAGGKTVALKTACLSALMLRAGLPIAASAESEAGLFEDVLADIGDAQSLDLSLSTFSARMQSLARILEVAGPMDLVALDEVCAGTDPDEGAALARAAVEALVEKGAAVVATTHYPALKERALSDARFENASVGFDPQTLGPTYRLHLGMPGPSAALHVAARCGVPEAVVARARANVPDASRTLSDAAERIEAAERRADEARQRAEATLREAEEAKARAMREVEAGREKGKRLVEREARELVETVRRAKTELYEAEGRIRRRRVKPADVAEAKEKLERVAEVVAPGGPVAEVLAPAAPAAKEAREADLAVGTRVWLVKMSHEATVLAAPAKGQVKVAAGPMRLTVKVDDLRLLPPKAGAAPRPRPVALDPAGDATSPAQTESNTVDVRGLRADEAEAEVDRFLDRLLREGKTAGFVIHGHGSGALRRALRAYLSKSAYVSRHAPSPDDGMTIVWMK